MVEIDRLPGINLILCNSSWWYLFRSENKPFIHLSINNSLIPYIVRVIRENSSMLYDINYPLL